MMQCHHTRCVWPFFPSIFCTLFFFTKFCKSLQFLYNKVKREIYPCVWCLIPNKQYKKLTFLYASEILWEEYVFLFKPHLSCYWLTLETFLWVVATLAGQMRTAVINWDVLPQMFTDVIVSGDEDTTLRTCVTVGGRTPPRPPSHLENTMDEPTQH